MPKINRGNKNIYSSEPKKVGTKKKGTTNNRKEIFGCMFYWNGMMKTLRDDCKWLEFVWKL